MYEFFLEFFFHNYLLAQNSEFLADSTFSCKAKILPTGVIDPEKTPRRKILWLIYTSTNNTKLSIFYLSKGKNQPKNGLSNSFLSHFQYLENENYFMEFGRT